MVDKNDTKPEKIATVDEKTQSPLEGKPPADKKSLPEEKLIKKPDSVPIMFHEVRGRIILLLMDYSKTLRQLSKEMDINPGTMKRYLQDLQDHDLIIIEKEEQNEFGINQIFYRAAAQNFIVEINFKGQYENYLKFPANHDQKGDKDHMDNKEKRKK